LKNRPTYASINLENLKYNFARIKEKVEPTTAVMAVVKANAYGHGDVEVAKILEAEGADTFGVAMAEEGIRLRQAGIKKPIILLGGLFPGQAPLCFEDDLTPVVFDLATAKELNTLASARKVKKKIHVKIDTGMGRLGILTDEVESFFASLKELASIEVEGLLSHFADMEVEDKAYSNAQLATFLETADRVDALGLKPGIRHMSNSASIIDFPDSHLDMIRPGLMLYGAYPRERFRGLIELKPALELKSEITHIKRLPQGSSISYGRTFVTERESVIATIPVGYGDGLPRRLSGKGEVIVRGKMAPIAGVVCMDLTMIDVTDIAGAAVGDEVVLIGTQGALTITVEEVAEKAGTISYEILCNIGARVPRLYI
jgi:alanine racemase